MFTKYHISISKLITLNIISHILELTFRVYTSHRHNLHKRKSNLDMIVCGLYQQKHASNISCFSSNYTHYRKDSLATLTYPCA